MKVPKPFIGPPAKQVTKLEEATLEDIRKYIDQVVVLHIRGPGVKISMQGILTEYKVDPDPKLSMTQPLVWLSLEHDDALKHMEVNFNDYSTIIYHAEGETPKIHCKYKNGKV